MDKPTVIDSAKEALFKDRVTTAVAVASLSVLALSELPQLAAYRLSLVQVSAVVSQIANFWAKDRSAT